MIDRCTECITGIYETAEHHHPAHPNNRCRVRFPGWGPCGCDCTESATIEELRNIIVMLRASNRDYTQLT